MTLHKLYGNGFAIAKALANSFVAKQFDTSLPVKSTISGTALAALRFPWQIRLSRLAPAAHFEQSECHWALAAVPVEFANLSKIHLFGSASECAFVGPTVPVPLAMLRRFEQSG